MLGRHSDSSYHGKHKKRYRDEALPSPVDLEHNLGSSPSVWNSVMVMYIPTIPAINDEKERGNSRGLTTIPGIEWRD